MIYKQELHGKTTFDLPKHAKILSAQLQQTDLVFWYYFDPKLPQETETYKFQVIGTGWDNDLSNYTFLNTVQQGNYVWHVFYCLMSET